MSLDSPLVVMCASAVGYDDSTANLVAFLGFYVEHELTMQPNPPTATQSARTNAPGHQMTGLAVGWCGRDGVKPH